MADATPRPAGSSLGTRLFLATVLIVALTIGAAVAATYLLGQRIAGEAVEEALGRSASVQSAFQEERLEKLGLIARLFVSDPYFTAYIQESIELGDRLSIYDQLDERRADLGFDFAIVLGADGRVVARTDDPTAAGDQPPHPLIARALEDSWEAYGVWVEDGSLFDAVVVPLTSGDLLVGYLVAAFAIDDLTALELRRVGGTEVAFLASSEEGRSVVASTLDAGPAGELAAHLAASPDLLAESAGEGAPPATRVVELGARRWLLQARPLAGIAGEPAGAVVSLASLAEQLRPYQSIGGVLVAVGVLAIVLASMVSFFLARRFMRPVRELVAATQAAAEGDYDREITAERGDEVGRLAAAFKSLLNELREKRDMEVYINELARNLPEPDQAEDTSERIVAPERREVALLGIELRGNGDAAAGASAREALDRLGESVRRVANAVAGQSGNLSAAAGHRLLASFEGPRRAQRALSSAAALLTRWNDAGGGEPPALVLTTGEAVSGSLTWSEHPQPALTGGPVRELETLLRGARPGDLLLSKAAHDELDELLRAAGLELRRHTLAKTLPLYLLTAEMAARVTHQDIDVTRQIGGDTAAGAMPATTFGSIGPGTVLGGRFLILKELGSGGMGMVFKARDRSLDELVALKMLKPAAWDDPSRLEQLKSELKLARKISHANVLSTFDFGELDGLPFISMEYVRGITLRQSLDQSGKPPFSAGLRLARQVCRGLAAAHEQGVLHRDIKPENLIIEHTGNVKLMDFGIAQPVRRTTASQEKPGMLVGTPIYLAPEQIEGKEADQRADVYACGVVFYELFTGELPLSTSGTLMQVLSRKVKEDPQPPSAAWPGIPKPLEAILLRCLDRDRDRRYPDVEALLAELEQLRA